MGAGSSSASTKAPGHHVAIAGLTGITHGTTRHVTWAFYHETGYYTVYVQHDGLSGRRAIQSNGRELAAQRFNLNLLDSSSSHHFVLATNQLIDATAARALDEQIVTRRAAAEKNKKMLEPISKKPEDATVVVRIVEENVRFVYSLIIDGLSYRLYQRWFWTHAYIWKFPRVALTRKRRQRPPEEGIRDEEHSCVYIVGTTPVMLLDGEPITMQSGFCEGEGTQHTFDAEPDVPVVLWIVPKKPSEVAAAIAAANASAAAAAATAGAASTSASVDGHDHAYFGIQDPSSRGHARLTFDYKLKVGNGAWLEPIAQPPLLSPQWQARGDQAVRKLPDEKPVNPPTEAAVAATTTTTTTTTTASADAVADKVAEMKVAELAPSS